MTGQSDSKNDSKKRDPVISTNKNASRNYHFIDKYEAGLVLTGTEVKSLRNNGAQLNDAYGVIERNEIYVLNMHIAPYSHGNRSNHEPLRKRKLLLRTQEIRKLIGAVTEKGLTLVATKLYWSKGRAKIELALAKGKNKGDKREDIKKRDAKREVDFAKKRSR